MKQTVPDRKKVIRISALFLIVSPSVGTILAQQAQHTVNGRVLDGTGGAIADATVTVTDAQGNTETVTTNATGRYVFSDLPPGRYTVRVLFAGFAPYENPEVEIAPGRTTFLPILLSLAVVKQEITIQPVGVFNPRAVVLGHYPVVVPVDEFDALADDPDDLAADLEALAGSSAGPQGPQMFIDGFTGARLPPKTSIREFRTNQNPFSAAYDRVGFGRIEVFTKPGSDKLRGQVFFNFGHAIFNARNPFFPSDRPLIREQFYGGTLSGPLNKRASFSVDLERREVNTKALINATVLDSALNVTPLRQAIGTPQRRTSLGPRLDYQWNPDHTLVGRYTHTRAGRDNAGIGDLSLSSRAYATLESEHSFQLTETAVLGARVINETRFQFVRTATDQFGDNSVPTLNVSDAFTGGGAEIGHFSLRQNRWEIQNYTHFVRGAHSLRWGVRLRGITISDVAPQNFGGTFRFSSGTGPQLDGDNQVVRDAAGQPVQVPITALERYRRTVLFLSQGPTGQQIRGLGGGPSQFSLTAGNPEATVNQADLGLFVQDDWRFRPNFMLSLGLRYETQNNIPHLRDFAPRIGFAWAPGRSRQRNTALRFGFGVFYDRFSEKLTLQAIRLNGLNLQQYLVRNPNFFPDVPPVETLTNSRQSATIRRLASDLRTPYVLQTSIAVERLFPLNTKITTTLSHSHGLHLLRSRNINAPLPGTFIPAVTTSGIRPYGPGNIFLYESVGILNQSQWNTNVTSRFHPKVTLIALYVLNYSNSNTDGAGTFPADSYDDRLEYGRSVLDERNRFVLGASILGPAGFQFSPFVVVRSGTPFNITTGTDLNGDTLLTERPAFETDLVSPGGITTPYGVFDPDPFGGEEIIPRNYGSAPGYFTVNLRFSRAFGFGPSKSKGAKSDASSAEPTGVRDILKDTLTDKRYNLTLAVSLRNLLNSTNPGTPVGNLTSPLFGSSNTLADSYAPAPGAGNRRVEVQLRLKF